MDKTDHDLLIEIHAKVTGMERRLFGNGQPGTIAEIWERIEETERKVHLLQSFRWLLGGAVAVVAFLLGAYGRALVAAIRG